MNAYTRGGCNSCRCIQGVANTHLCPNPAYERNRKFLGVALNPALSFAAHITKIKSICQNRTAILKILAGRQWKLPKSTFTKL